MSAWLLAWAVGARAGERAPTWSVCVAGSERVEGLERRALADALAIEARKRGGRVVIDGAGCDVTVVVGARTEIVAGHARLVLAMGGRGRRAGIEPLDRAGEVARWAMELADGDAMGELFGELGDAAEGRDGRSAGERGGEGDGAKGPPDEVDGIGEAGPVEGERYSRANEVDSSMSENVERQDEHGRAGIAARAGFGLALLADPATSASSSAFGRLEVGLVFGPAGASWWGGIRLALDSPGRSESGVARGEKVELGGALVMGLTLGGRAWGGLSLEPELGLGLSHRWSSASVAETGPFGAASLTHDELVSSLHASLAVAFALTGRLRLAAVVHGQRYLSGTDLIAPTGRIDAPRWALGGGIRVEVGL